jgi:hypothetical protein
MSSTLRCTVLAAAAAAQRCGNGRRPYRWLALEGRGKSSACRALGPGGNAAFHNHAPPVEPVAQAQA